MAIAHPEIDALFRDLAKMTGPDAILARQFKALADPTRIKILKLLAQHEGNICVFELVRMLDGLSQPTVSHHLHILAQAKFITGQRHGLFAYYRVDREQIERFLSDAINALA